MKVERLLLLAALLFSACASNRYSIVSSTLPGSTSEAWVLGDEPRISLENQGPGSLRVEFDSPDDSVDESVTITAGETTTRTLPGPVRLRIELTGDERSKWRLMAHESDGVGAVLLQAQESDG